MNPGFSSRNELASAFEPLRAVHTGSVVDLPITAALTPQTFAATPIGTATVTGTCTPFSAATCVSFRKFFRMSTLETLTFTRPPWVLTWAIAGVAVAAITAAAIIILRITFSILSRVHSKGTHVRASLLTWKVSRLNAPSV